MKINKNYHNLLEKIIQEGYTYEDPNRKGVNRIEIPSYTFRHEFKDGFPAITTKKLNYKSVATELIWFLRGDTNIKYLVDNGCNIWNKDAYNYFKKEGRGYGIGNNKFIEGVLKEYCYDGPHFEWGNLGKVYGHYWRNYDGFDQIKDIINKMINTPMSSEIIVTARNPNDKDNQALPCCHYGFQIVVKPLTRADMLLYNTAPINSKTNRVQFENSTKYGFELHWQQRSVDTFLGLPFNIASYATLALILEKITGYKALAIQGDLKKVHLYDNSLDAVKEQLSRDVDKYGDSKLMFNNGLLFESFRESKLGFSKDSGNGLNELIKTFTNDNFILQNYESYPYIKCEMLERDE